MESSPTSDSSPRLSPPCKRIPSEFVDSLLAALDDERISKHISHTLRQKVEEQENTIQECVRIWTDEKELNGEVTDAIVLELAKKMEIL